MPASRRREASDRSRDAGAGVRGAVPPTYPEIVKICLSNGQSPVLKTILRTPTKW